MILHELACLTLDDFFSVLRFEICFHFASLNTFPHSSWQISMQTKPNHRLQMLRIVARITLLATLRAATRQKALRFSRITQKYPSHSLMNQLRHPISAETRRRKVR